MVLASCGSCGIYEHTTNPTRNNALGFSVALTLVRLEDHVSGGMCILLDVEYVQFHSTALCVPNEQRFLIIEALRGEGTILCYMHGRAFTLDY